jgi:translocation and assembly module TamB
MTQSSGSAPDPNPRRRSPQWRKVVYILGLLALAGTAGGAWWGWVFIHEKLAPLVSDTLSQQLQRPVQIGKLERISPVGLRFGSSSLPNAKVASAQNASPDTGSKDTRSKAARSLMSGPPNARYEQDQLGPPSPEEVKGQPAPPSMANAQDGAHATVEAVEVGFNLWQLLQRKLDLDVTLVHPEAYIEQDTKGQWLNLAMGPGGEKPPIEVALKRLKLEDAKVTLSPLPKPDQTRNPVNPQ